MMLESFLSMKYLRLAFPVSLIVTGLVLGAEDPSPEHVKWMKDTDALNGKIRRNEDVAASAKGIAAIYKDVAAYWGKRDPEAGKAAEDVLKAATALAAAAEAGKTEEAQAQQKVIGGACRTCHNAHRERLPDGTNKIK
jgi:hypothetical protein